MIRPDRLERELAIVAAYRSGATMNEVAARFGLSATGVGRILKRHSASPSVEEAHERRLAGSKAKWKDPEFRARVAAGRRAKWRDPEFRQRKAADFRARRNDPEFCARQVAGSKAKWKDPAFRERHAAGVRAANSVWPDCPEHLLADYAILRLSMTATEARAMLEQGIPNDPA